MNKPKHETPNKKFKIQNQTYLQKRYSKKRKRKQSNLFSFFDIRVFNCRMFTLKLGENLIILKLAKLNSLEFAETKFQLFIYKVLQGST